MSKSWRLCALGHSYRCRKELALPLLLSLCFLAVQSFHQILVPKDYDSTQRPHPLTVIGALHSKVMTVGASGWEENTVNDVCVIHVVTVDASDGCAVWSRSKPTMIIIIMKCHS